MDELTIHPGFLQSLILKTRALMAQEELVSPDSGSNPTDDEGGPTTLQEDPDNLIRDELIAEIEDLEPDQQAELVALMWIGRGDMEPEEWRETIEYAVSIALATLTGNILGWLGQSMLPKHVVGRGQPSKLAMRLAMMIGPPVGQQGLRRRAERIGGMIKTMSSLGAAAGSAAGTVYTGIRALIAM